MLNSLLKPRSVALIGASQTPGKMGFEILSNIVKLGYQGKIYPVNPKATEIWGHPVYPCVKRIPGAIDLAVIALPAPLVAGVLKECGQKKVKSVVIISAGFKEVGPEGQKREQEIKQICQKYQMAAIGPNCLGIINTERNLNASFAEGLPKKGNISLLSQSGAMAVAITDWAYQADLGFHVIVSLGNKMDVTETELMAYLFRQKQTEVLMMYLESIEQGEEFMAKARKIALKKPIIAVKAGVSASGSQAIASHTGSLAGSNKAVEAAFRQSGLIRANSVEDMFDLARAFSMQPLPQGNKIAVVTNAGGPGVLTADAIAKSSLQLAQLEPQTQKALKKSLPAAASIKNPVDIIGDALADRYHSALEAVLQDPQVDMVLTILTPQIMTEKEKTTNTIIELNNRFPKKTIVTAFLGGKNIQYATERLRDHNIPNFYPERAIQVLSLMSDYQEWKNIQEKAKSAGIIKKVSPQETKGLRKKIQKEIQKGYHQLSADLTSELLEAYQIHFPPLKLARKEKEAQKKAQEIGFPVALKVSSGQVLHKTEIGGVRIGLKDETEVQKAFREIKQNIKKQGLTKDVNGVLIQKMCRFGQEVIIGMKRDPSFGPLIMFGLGGIYVEVMKDVSFRVAPVCRQEAYDMIHEVKSIKLLQGVRGHKPADIDCLAETIQEISRLALAFPEIKELDINPLLVRAEGLGVEAVDTRIVV